jgi:class 3 adenylate cyclase
MTQTYKGIEIPENEDSRVAAVKSYGILETPPERQYDDITELAAEITGCPVSYISIFDETRSWLKSSYGLPPNRPPRPREQSMCAPTICQTEMIVVPDLGANPRYAGLPAVVNPPHARFYCGMPLINRDSYALGTLCVWNHAETDLTETQLNAMRRLGRLVMDLLEARRDVLMAEEAAAALEAKLDRGRTALERAEQVAYRLLPSAAAVRLLSNADIPPRVHDNVTAVCVSFADFSRTGDGLGLTDLAETLGEYAAVLDRVVADAGLERIGMIGESYVAIAGMPRARDDHAEVAAEAVARLSTEIAALSEVRAAKGLSVWTPRIGFGSGGVCSAVIGEAKASHVVFGDAIEAAAASLGDA